MKTRFLLLSLALLLAIGLAACGGGGDSSGGGGEDESQIETTIETAATSTDPADCTKFATLTFMEQTTGEEGPAAEKACEEEAEEGEGKPEGASVSNIEVDGEKATAEAEFEGGDAGGFAFTVALVKEDGDWKLDELTGFANFDAEKLTQTLVDQLEEEEAASPELISCVAEGLEELDESEYEEIVINQETEAVAKIAEGCE